MASTLLPRAALVVALALAFGACSGDGGDDGSGRPVADADCESTPPASVAAPSLPDGIPWPQEVVATAVDRSDDVLRADGYAVGTLDEVRRRFRAAFDARSLLTLEPDEEGADRATYVVGGPSTQGTLRLTAACDQVAVHLELRPLIGG